jgi:Protein of unknown function (DUF4230)
VKRLSKRYEKKRHKEGAFGELRASEREAAAASAVYHRSRSERNSWKLMTGVLAFWKNRVLLVLLVVILAVGGTAAFMYAWLSGSTFTEEKGSFVERIQDMSSLATAQGFVKAVIEQEDNQIFGKEISADLPGTKRELLLVVPGKVLAGVDLQLVDKNDIVVDEEKKEIQLTLPRAEILQEPSLDTDKIKTFSVEGIFRDEVDWKEGFAFAEVAKDMISKEAVDQGLLQAAEKNAEKSLKGFFEQLGYKVTITYEN